MPSHEEVAVDEAAQRALQACERRYRDLAHELAEIGFIASGSVALRSNRCGKAYCACHGDPPRLHGPYWLFTAKVNGKTVNKRLNESEARLYNEWIANDRKVRVLLGQMREVASKAQELLLANEAAGPGSDAKSTASSPEND
jgi:hypothetical protein